MEKKDLLGKTQPNRKFYCRAVSRGVASLVGRDGPHSAEGIEAMLSSGDIVTHINMNG